MPSADAFASPGTHWAPAARPAAGAPRKPVNSGFFAGSLLVTRTTDLLRDARLRPVTRPDRSRRQGTTWCPAHSASGLRGPAPTSACPPASRRAGSARPPWTNRGVSRRPIRPRASLASVEKEASFAQRGSFRGGVPRGPWEQSASRRRICPENPGRRRRRDLHVMRRSRFSSCRGKAFSDPSGRASPRGRVGWEFESNQGTAPEVVVSRSCSEA